MNITKRIPRIGSSELKQQLPLSSLVQRDIQKHRQELSDIIQSKSGKNIVIVGPCSADFEDSMMKYAEKIRLLQEQVNDKIMLVMRVYTAKPRTTYGRKGIERSGELGTFVSPDQALYFTRKLLLQIANLGVPIANELLYPENTPYLHDLLSYGAIGSRSSLNQGHRELASGVDFPIGIKNPLGEDCKGCVDSMQAINHPQEMIYDGEYCYTSGNPDAHIVLRGTNKNGVAQKNYDIQSIQYYQNTCEVRGLNSNIIVDLNHDNSGKDGLQQPQNMQEIIAQNNKNIVGVMIESYLHDGKQSDLLPHNKIVHGTSLTDSCLGREKTEQLIFDFYSHL